MKAKLSVMSVVLTILFNTSLFAQFENFHLDKYKVADYKRQELDLNFKTEGNNNRYKIEYFDTTKQKNEYFDFQINTTYKNLINTRKQQQSIFINTNIAPFAYNYSNTNSNTGIGLPRTSKNSVFSIIANLNKKIYTKNNYFVGLENYTSYEYSRTATNSRSYNNSTYTRSKEILTTNRLYQSFSISFGKGRIENVEDARLAIFILEDLLKNNKLVKELSESEIQDFATKITQLKNKRFFDTRIRKKQEIQVVDSFLRNNNFVNSQDAIYFTTIFDNWNFSNNPIRQSGSRISLNYIPYLTYSKNGGEDYHKNFSSQFNQSIEVAYTIAKPINLKWQRDISIQAGFNHSYLRESISYDSKRNSYYANLVVTYGYYPNSRSYYTIDLYGRLFKTFKSENSSKSLDRSFSFNLNAFYFISEQFLLSANAGLNYYNNLIHLDVQDFSSYHISPSFSIRLAYSLF